MKLANKIMASLDEEFMHTQGETDFLKDVMGREMTFEFTRAFAILGKVFFQSNSKAIRIGVQDKTKGKEEIEVQDTKGNTVGIVTNFKGAVAITIPNIIGDNFFEKVQKLVPKKLKISVDRE